MASQTMHYKCTGDYIVSMHSHTHCLLHWATHTALIYHIHGNFRGSYISRITCQEGFCVLIFADDLPLNEYTPLEILGNFPIFQMTDE